MLPKWSPLRIYVTSFMQDEIKVWLEDIEKAISEINEFLPQPRNFLEFEKDLNTGQNSKYCSIMPFASTTKATKGNKSGCFCALLILLWFNFIY